LDKSRRPQNTEKAFLNLTKIPVSQPTINRKAAASMFAMVFSKMLFQFMYRKNLVRRGIKQGFLPRFKPPRSRSLEIDICDSSAFCFFALRQSCDCSSRVTNQLKQCKRKYFLLLNTSCVQYIRMKTPKPLAKRVMKAAKAVKGSKKAKKC